MILFTAYNNCRFIFFLQHVLLLKKITTIHNYPDIDSVFRRGRIVMVVCIFYKKIQAIRVCGVAALFYFSERLLQIN